jgi:hypothetical protein
MSHRLNRVKSYGAVLGLISALALSVGCGGNSTQPSTRLSAVQLKIGDAPSDRVIAFEITVNSLVLTDTNGGSVSVLSSPTQVEFSHLSATMEPLSINNIAQGNYTAATITVSSPQVTFIDPTTGQVIEKNATLTTNTATVNFNPSLSINGTLTSLNFDFDLNLPSSVSIDANNNVSVTPVFTASAATIVAENVQEEDDGEIDDLVGFVTGASGSSFSISAQDVSQTLNFAVDGNTQFEGVGGVSGLSNGMIVEVEAVTQPDNSLLAKHVEVKVANASGEEAEGLITQVSGVPASQFSIAVREEAAPGTIFPPLGSILTVNLTPNTLFNINKDHVDLSNLPFVPRFDATSLAKAQNVEADTNNPSSTNFAAQSVELQQQAIVGTVSAYTQSGSQASFALTVPSDSAFAMLTGSTTVMVFQQSSTELKGITAINNGDTVRVRGLLFLDLGTYKFVARRIGKP